MFGKSRIKKIRESCGLFLFMFTFTLSFIFNADASLYIGISGGGAGYTKTPGDEARNNMKTDDGFAAGYFIGYAVNPLINIQVCQVKRLKCHI